MTPTLARARKHSSAVLTAASAPKGLSGASARTTSLVVDRHASAAAAKNSTTRIPASRSMLTRSAAGVAALQCSPDPRSIYCERAGGGAVESRTMSCGETTT